MSSSTPAKGASNGSVAGTASGLAADAGEPALGETCAGAPERSGADGIPTSLGAPTPT